MRFLKLQLNTPAQITRDISVDLINDMTGKQVSAKPFLDGTVKVRDVEPGPWRVKVKHPNFVHDLIDRRVRVFKDQPTFVPIKIPKDIFEDTPIRETKNADLGPEQARLDDAADQAERQANKVGGQPIFADDWNDMAFTVADVARSTRDLSSKVSVQGHDHSELEEKIEEMQRNLDSLYDVFGKTVTELQRQLQKLALQQQVSETLDQIPDIDARKRKEMEDLVQELEDVKDDPPHIYTTRFKRVGEKMGTRFAEILPADDQVRNKQQVVELNNVINTMSNTYPVHSYGAEIGTHKKVENQRKTKAFEKIVGIKGR